MFVKKPNSLPVFGLGSVARNVKTVLWIYVHVPFIAFGSICTCFLRSFWGQMQALCMHQC